MQIKKNWVATYRKKEVIIMTNKMTKREWFAVLADVVTDSAIENKEGALAFIEHEVALLERKSVKSAPTKTQKENVETMNEIETVLGAIGEPATIRDIQAQSETLAPLSNQKVSALLRLMRLDGRVTATKDKKVTMFALA